MPRPSKNILSAEIIADTALKLVERNHDFTIPGIARELGVNPSSLYHHVKGGRNEIINLMRYALYGRIDLGGAMDESSSWQERLRAWIRGYRDSMAQLPAALPLLVGAPVDDVRTLEIYEVVFSLLSELGVAEDEQVDLVAMLDAVVLGSAVDGSAPAPLWRIGDHDMPHLGRAVALGDDAGRADRGLELAISAMVALIETRVGSTGSRTA